MKKIIAISVMFVLLTGAVFAVDVGGTVFGHVNVLESDTGKDSKVNSSGHMDRVRLDGSGEAGDGAFGGYIRMDGGNGDGWNTNPIDSANAWWKPIDQLKLIIGNNSDGFWGKEGVTGWSFNQMPYDCAVAINPGIWYGAWGDASKGEWYGPDVYAALPWMNNRYTFFGGYGANGLLLEITPADIATINIAIPVFDGGTKDGKPSKETADVFKAAVAQLNINLDVGNIAITYNGGDDVAGLGSAGAIFAYFGGTFGDLGLDVGLGYHLSGDKDTAINSDAAFPIGVGLGVKYATDAFGVKFRVTAALGGDDKGTYINTSVLPFFNLSDGMTAFVNVGLGMIMPDEGDATTGWYFNPYLRVGAEWGPTFYFGVKVSSSGEKDADDKTTINWAVPIALQVSF